MIDPVDAARWKLKLAQVADAAADDEAVTTAWSSEEAERPSRDAEMRPIIADLQSTGDFGAFRDQVDAWRKRPGPYQSFGGFGQMWINQVAKSLPEGDSAIVETISAALGTPATIEESLEKIQAVSAVTEDLAGKGFPAMGRVPYVLSIFWATDTEVSPRWPVMWNSAPERMAELGWTRVWTNQERWPLLVEAARQFFPTDVSRFDRLMKYLTDHRFVGVSPALGEMCAEAADLMSSYQRGSGYADDETARRAESLAHQIRGEITLAGSGLLSDLSARLERDFLSQKIDPRIAFEKSGAFRADGHTVWVTVDEARAPSLRLWATRSGIALGVHAYSTLQPGGGDAVVERMRPYLPPHAQFFQIEPHVTGDRLNPVSDYRTGDVFVGSWWPWSKAPGGLAMGREVLDRAQALLPVLDAVAPTTVPTEPSRETGPGGEDELDVYVARFRTSQPYPSERDEQHREARRRFAEALSADNLAVLDLAEFRRLVNSSTGYGGTGPQSVLNTSVQGMDSQGLDEFARRLHEILWGHGTVDMRIDRALDWNDLGTKGLGESVLLKMFAIVDPDRFLPVFPLLGPNGKIAMLRRLGLAEPDRELSLGKRHVIANDTLRGRLEPLFPEDPWGQAQFGYWLLQNDLEAPSEIDLLGKTADQILVAESFLQEIKELLLEKGQVVFYGPPGTGKTFIADKFAAAIQPDPERRMTVQFHPSMSYEDFFEGYRPRSDNGQLVYDLRPGPLALLAERAAAAPGVPHLLIIDELNRANLPRVFGELLYLLEYRNKSVRTAYRGEETFELPENLYVIGTMNTADRSIAMIDAALRRRFHFIPFLPHEGELSGVLKRWLKFNEEPAWVAGLVNEVNEQLRVQLRGSHLLIGHSHFMVAGAGAEKPTVLTEQRLRRIWEYGVYPMIEDQLHGRPEQLAAFTWPAVLDRYGPGSATADDADIVAEDDANDA